jgi:hypothetical protein
MLLLIAALVVAVAPAGPVAAADVNLAVGTLPPQGTVTIEFEVQIDAPVAPLATTHSVCNQATVSGSNFSTLSSEDLELGPGATCTSLPDFGDAPSPYPTMLAANGARHGLRSDLFLGATADAEPDGQPNAGATGDDSDGNDDADGVTFASYEGALPALALGATNNLDVFLNSGGETCLLNAWIDFNANGVWTDAGEQIFTNQPLSSGANNGLPYDVPAGAVLGTTYSRFRCSTTAGLTPTGEAPDGEVEDYQVLIAQSSISVTKTASPTSLAEPGGSVTFTVRIDNTGNTSVDMTSLIDDIHGNLNGQGTCSVPQTIAIGAFYQCSFSANVNGNASDSETDTVTASGTSAVGPVSDTGSATVTITDVLPSISATKTAAPSSVAEPGASVTFTVRIDNLGSAESVSLTSVVDDIHGNLNGQGSCTVPQTIAASSFYECSFSANVNGNAGDSETNTVTAGAEDDETNPTQAQDSATVTITDVLPAITVTKTASPTSIDEPGGPVSFTVRVDNTGTAEPVTLTTLSDDIHGDIDGQGDCSVPQTIAASGFYQCSFTVTVNGNAGDSETDTVTATAEDDETNQTQAQDSATVTFTGIDFGDAPAPYPTLLSGDDGARHTLGSGLFLGALVDAEPDGQPDATATGDDLARLDDEDGVSFGIMVPGTNATVDVVASGACTLDAWIDFNADGDWDDAGEQVFTNQSLAAGANPGLVFAVPAGASFGYTFARFRASTDTDLLPTGLASDGEVEDYRVTIGLTAITVTKTPAPASVPEPGGNVMFTVRVDNTGSDTADIESLVDDVYGDLDGQGTCSVPQTVATGSFYECSFSGAVAGDAGSVHSNTVTATATSIAGPGSDDGSASVTITDVLPTISVTKSASPTSIEEPGGTITFTVRVDNTGTAESVNLTSLVDDIHGDLNGQGDCSLSQTIAVAGFYECSFDASVTGVAGDSETDTVTATAEDNELNPVSEQDSATVNIVDPTPPVVTALATVPGGALDECITVNAAISQFNVTFSEELANPTDAGGYLLVGSGPDYDLSTLDCSGASGDDQPVPFDTITSDGDPVTPTASLAVTDLAPGLYRLLVCDTLIDVDSNPLDGDESGDGGGNLVRSFRADPGNLFVNGDFDDCPVSLSPWDTFATAPDAVLPAIPGTSDRDDSPLSAAVELMSSTGDELGVGQCLPVEAETDYQLRAWLQVDGLGGDDPLATFVRRCTFYPQPGCAGEEIGSGVFVSVVTDTEGGWLAYISSLLSPAGAGSASCELAIVPASGSQPDVLMDGLFFGGADVGELIFTDGFESGDTSAWFATVP